MSCHGRKQLNCEKRRAWAVPLAHDATLIEVGNDSLLKDGVNGAVRSSRFYFILPPADEENYKV